jgi:glycosyltransferase involved in cell wall biosynthesis
LLTSAANDEALAAELPGLVRHRAQIGAGWLPRFAWMRRHGASLCRSLDVDCVFTPAGLLSEGLPRQQVVLAQNPWPMLPHAPGRDAARSWLQRRAYARAQSNAAVMVYNSAYMRDLYRQRFGDRSGASVVAHQGIGEDLFTAGADAIGRPRDPIVLSVSVMARHKAIEVLVDAFARVHAGMPSARLELVGTWPDPRYRREVDARIAASGATAAITVRGHVERSQLHALYASASVFCLPSRCESFGIPAVEAQAFGTPAVVAQGTAAPEIIGDGGIAVPADDREAIASALSRILGSGQAWATWSMAARENAERFHWRRCSAPLSAALDELERARVRS